jgi:hypothetical protein
VQQLAAELGRVVPPGRQLAQLGVEDELARVRQVLDADQEAVAGVDRGAPVLVEAHAPATVRQHPADRLEQPAHPGRVACRRHAAKPPSSRERPSSGRSWHPPGTCVSSGQLGVIPAGV